MFHASSAVPTFSVAVSSVKWRTCGLLSAMRGPKILCLDLDFYSALGATKLVKRTEENFDEPFFLALAFSG